MWMYVNGLLGMSDATVAPNGTPYATVTEDKRTFALHEAKIRDLQLKSAALVAIEKDVRACVEQQQAIEKEVQMLEDSRKALADLKDQLSEKRAEESEPRRKAGVRVLILVRISPHALMGCVACPHSICQREREARESG